MSLQFCVCMCVYVVMGCSVWLVCTCTVYVEVMGRFGCEYEVVAPSGVT